MEGRLYIYKGGKEREGIEGRRDNQRGRGSGTRRSLKFHGKISKSILHNLLGGESFRFEILSLKGQVKTNLHP